MDLDLDRLQELAEGASNWCDEWVVSAAFQQRNAWDKHTSNYLAACDPRTILALIERVRRAEGCHCGFASHWHCVRHCGFAGH